MNFLKAKFSSDNNTPDTQTESDPLEGLLTATIHKSPSLKAEFTKQWAADGSKE